MAKNEIITSSESSRWVTPPYVVDWMSKRFGPVVWDAAAEGKSRKGLDDRLQAYFGPDHPKAEFRDALAIDDWLEATKRYLPKNTSKDPHQQNLWWLNPPYGLEKPYDLMAWTEKVLEESRKGCRIAYLVYSRTETEWFQDIVFPQAAITYFLRGRIPFWDPDTLKPRRTVLCAKCGKRAAGRTPCTCRKPEWVEKGVTGGTAPNILCLFDYKLWQATGPRHLTADCRPREIALPPLPPPPPPRIR